MSKGKGGNVSAAVWQIAEPIASELGISLWDIRFLKEGADWFLRIILDKEGGVGIDDCEAFSRAIDKPLDELDPIEQSYCLEVSSPGLERELTRPEHFERFKGSPVKVRLIRPVDGVRDFKGILEECDKNRITLRLENGGAMDLDKKETSYIKLDDFE